MTWRKGGQWKSSWSRQKQYGFGALVDMWFLNLASGYATAAPAPFPFQSGTHWMGYVVRVSGVVPAGSVLLDLRQSGATGAIMASTFVLDTTSAITPVYETVSNYIDATAPTNIDVDVTQYHPGVGLAGGVHVVLVTVVPGSGATQTVNVWMDGALRRTATVPNAFVASATNAALTQVPAGLNLFNGFAGGTTLPTDAEISQWFADVKSNADIQQIPGKTTTIISASAVAPAAPGVLPNGIGGAQAFNTLGGVPTNVQASVFFNY